MYVSVFWPSAFPRPGCQFSIHMLTWSGPWLLLGRFVITQVIAPQVHWSSSHPLVYVVWQCAFSCKRGTTPKRTLWRIHYFSNAALEIGSSFSLAEMTVPNYPWRQMRTAVRSRFHPMVKRRNLLRYLQGSGLIHFTERLVAHLVYLLWCSWLYSKTWVDRCPESA